MSEQAYLQVRNLSFRYEADRMILNRVSFEVERGEILTILGPNGAGKSTLLNCLCGLQRPTEGEILVMGKNTSEISPRNFARHVAYVSQGQNRVYDFTVRDYVAMGRAPYLGITQSPSEKDYALVDEALELMNLTALADKFYTHISGGECQRAMIARAIVQQADLIVLDEPTNHLDYGNQIKVLQEIRRLADQGFGVLWTTHMPDHALMLGGKVAIVERSGVLTTGNANDLLTQQRLTELYGTEICRTYVEGAGREACLPYRLT